MNFKDHLIKNVKLASPVVVGQLGHIMVSVADTAMVGRVGVIPLAASTFAGTFIHILLLFGLGVSYAITPLVAAEDQNNREKHLKLLQSGFFLNTGIGIILALVGISVYPFLGYFGQDPAVASEAGSYLLVMMASVIPLMVFQTFRQYSEGLSDTFKPMIISIVANLLNIALNYVLIFGKFGAPALGLLGAGYATLIARIVMAILMILILRGKIHGFSFSFELSLIKEMFRIGIPSGLQYVFEVGAFAFASIMVGWIGAEYLAAHQIVLNISAVTYMAATGIAAASTVRVGNQIGLKDKINLRLAAISCFALVAFFMTCCGIIFVVFNVELVSLYIADPFVIGIAANILIIAAGFQVSDGLQAVGLGVLRGLTDVKVPTIVTFFAYWVVSIPLGYVLAFTFEMGITGVWIALLTGLTMAAVLHIVRFRKKLRVLRF